MFGQVRTNRSTVLMAGTVIFLVAFVSLAYNHLDKWEPPADVATDTETSIIGDTHDEPHHDEPKKTEPEQPEQHGAMSKPDHPSNASTELGDYYFNYIMKARISPAD
ncbi:galactosyl transferase, partial [Fusarium mundagurra]